MAKQITLTEAIDLTHAYQNSQMGSGQTISAFVSTNDLEKILTQEKCKGLRIYNALESDGKINFVLVGTDTDGNDMTNGVILNFLDVCPRECPSSKSPLQV